MKQTSTQYEEEEDEDFIEKVLITSHQSNNNRETVISKNSDDEDKINIRGREESFAIFDRFLFQIMIGKVDINPHSSARAASKSINT